MTDSEKFRVRPAVQLSIPLCPARPLRPRMRWGNDRKPLAPSLSLFFVCVGGVVSTPPPRPSWTAAGHPLPPGGGTELLCAWKLGRGWAIPPPALGSWGNVCLHLSSSLKLSFEYRDLVFYFGNIKANPLQTAFSPFLHFVTFPSLAHHSSDSTVTLAHFICICLFCFFF